MTIKIDYDKCCWKEGSCSTCSCCGEKKCEGCVEICPTRALERKDKLIIIPENCISCGACVDACKKGAISLEE